MTLEDAIEKAMQDCIDNDILADFITKNKEEVKATAMQDFIEEEAMRRVCEQEDKEEQKAEDPVRE